MSNSRHVTGNHVDPAAGDLADGAVDGDDQDQSFEQAIRQLEGILEQVESGEIGLEASLSQYERGRKLIVRCQMILDRAQTRVNELTASADGDVTSQPSDALTPGGGQADADGVDRAATQGDDADDAPF